MNIPHLKSEVNERSIDNYTPNWQDDVPNLMPLPFDKDPSCEGYYVSESNYASSFVNSLEFEADKKQEGEQERHWEDEISVHVSLKDIKDWVFRGFGHDTVII